MWGKKHSLQSVAAMTSHENRPRFKGGEDNPNFVRYGHVFFANR